MQKIRIGFIGLGLMGNPMATNIHKAGFPLTVYNRSVKRTAEFKKLGISIATSPKELARQSDVVITMVTGPTDVEDVLFGNDGVAKGKHVGLVVVDMSTIGVSAAKEIGKKLKQENIDFIDAPVTGSTMRAKSAELTIFIGGNEKTFEKIKPMFLAMGNNLCYIGVTGTGQAIKLVNNALVAIATAGLAEGMLLADALKISRQNAAKALQDTPVFSAYMKMKLPNMVNDDFTTAFSVANMHKDLLLALKELKKSKKKLPILSLVAKLFGATKERGMGDKDISAVLSVLAS